jgi:uncharacterized alpha-E superfamily protein
LPSAAFVGSSIANAQWEVILRSVSAERSYRWLHSGESSASMISNFLILDGRMPRSLAFCAKTIGKNLNDLEIEYQAREESHVQADALCHKMNAHTVDTIFEEGLHEFLTGFIADNAKLAAHIEEDFRFYG